MIDVVAKVWEELFRIAKGRDLLPLLKQPGAFELGDPDEGWYVAVNGHRHEVEVRGSKVPPFTAYVQWNGWPAGLLTPMQGTIAAGEAANGETLVAWLQGVR